MQASVSRALTAICCLIPFVCQGPVVSAQQKQQSQQHSQQGLVAFHASPPAVQDPRGSSGAMASWALMLMERARAAAICDENEWPYQPCASTRATEEMVAQNSIQNSTQNLFKGIDPKTVDGRISSSKDPRVGSALPAAKAPSAKTSPAKPAVSSTAAEPASGDAVQIITLPNASGQPVVHYSLGQSSQYREGSRSNANRTAPRAMKVLAAMPAKATYSYLPPSGPRYAMEAMANAPALSSPGGTYTGTQTVMLTSSSPGAEIYYTLDGQDPTTDSTPYTQPIVLTSSATLRAFAVAKGLQPSEVTRATYTINAPALSIEVNVRAGDRVEVVSRLKAQGAISVAGRWAIAEGDNQICSAEQTTQTAWRCPLRLTKGMHKLTATYAGANNGWRLAANSTLRVK